MGVGIWVLGIGVGRRFDQNWFLPSNALLSRDRLPRARVEGLQPLNPILGLIARKDAGCWEGRLQSMIVGSCAICMFRKENRAHVRPD